MNKLLTLLILLLSANVVSADTSYYQPSAGGHVEFAYPCKRQAGVQGCWQTQCVLAPSSMMWRKIVYVFHDKQVARLIPWYKNSRCEGRVEVPQSTYPLKYLISKQVKTTSNGFNAQVMLIGKDQPKARLVYIVKAAGTAKEQLCFARGDYSHETGIKRKLAGYRQSKPTIDVSNCLSRFVNNKKK